MSSELAAVVVTCNSAAVIEPCLRSVGKLEEVVVVDNGSVDGTRRIVSTFGRVRLVANPRNRGFAAAANQGVKATSAPMLLFLNPDAEVVGNLGTMVERLKVPGVGAVAGRLVDHQGSTQVGFNVRRLPTPAALALEALLVNRLWPGNPVNRQYRCLGMNYDRAQDVEQPAGAFLMARRDALEAVGCWDEGFSPLWFEDVDLCRRIRGAGYRIVYVPECSARHQGGHSLERISLEQKQIYWYGSLLRYADKHFSPRGRFWMRAGVVGGALLRMGWALGSGKDWRVYSKVMGLALGRSAGEARQVQPHVLT
jgi:GT2 family glycosyltransferase